MADDDQDDEQKTEQPSQKRLDDAHQKGNIPVSKEVANFMIMMSLAITVAWYAPGMLRSARMMLAPFISDADDMAADRNGLGLILKNLIFGSASIVMLPAVTAMVAGIASNVLQNGLIITSEPIMPQLSRISPLAGIKRMFSMRSVVELIKSLLKVGVIGYVAFLSIYPEMMQVRTLPNTSAEGLLLLLAKLGARMTIGVAIAMFFIALFDILYQRFQHNKSLRMTRQEVKDEYKQSEGDPMIKGRLRRLRQERAKNRMMSAVPTADVVITNPTHFAVALKYDGATMKAPTVVAKGQDLIALKIRELAQENKVPIIENPPLARALYGSAELDREIPMEQYEAVAKVISYVYKLKGRKL
jgi:flagellar biosynthetic protein FlhB